MTIHSLKCWPKYWSAIADGRKNFDVRKGEDRQYQVGDELRLQEYDVLKGFTGRQTRRIVGYIMHGGEWLPADVWVLGFREG